MPKARDYHLNEAELQAVETAIRRDKRPEVRQRCTAIRLLHLGHKPAQVAEMQAVSVPTIYAWINRWRKGGIEALPTQPRSGRPPKAGPAYRQRLGEVLEKEPAELGYGFTLWTIDRLRAHLAKETGIERSESRFAGFAQARRLSISPPKVWPEPFAGSRSQSTGGRTAGRAQKKPSETISGLSLWTKPR